MIFLALLRYFLYFSISASLAFLASSREDSWLPFGWGRGGGRGGREEKKGGGRRRQDERGGGRESLGRQRRGGGGGKQKEGGEGATVILTVYYDLLCSLLAIKSLWFFSVTSLSSRSIVVRCSATFLKSPSSPSVMVCEMGGERSTFQKTCIRLSHLHTHTVTGLDPRLSCRKPGNEANTASHTYRVP